MRLLIGLTALSLAALSISSEASASQVLFNITGANTISFTVDKSPIPDVITSHSFQLINVTFLENGQIKLGNIAFFDSVFTTDPFFFVLKDNYFNNDVLFPTFITGNYTANGGYINDETQSYNVSISDVSGAVPEPATWATMLLGFGAIGIAMRRRPRKLTRELA